MSNGINQALFEQRIRESMQLGKTSAYKLNTLIDLLVQKNVITQEEAKPIKDAKVY